MSYVYLAFRVVVHGYKNVPISKALLMIPLAKKQQAEHPCKPMSVFGKDLTNLLKLSHLA